MDHVISQGIVFAGTSTIKLGLNYCSDEPRLSGVLAQVAST